MNASQRRIFRRSKSIVPGATVCRTAIGHKTPTCAEMVRVDPANPGAIIVRRRDKREVSWTLAEVLRAQPVHA